MAAPGSRFSAQSRGRYQASSFGWIFLHLNVIVAASTAAGQSLPGCPSKCGEVDVPYPFGLSLNCSRDQTFVLTCYRTSNDGTGPPRLYTSGGYRVFSISIPHGHLDVSLFFIRDCYDRQGGSFIRSLTDSYWRVKVTAPLSISPDRNRFITTGCDSYFWYWNNWNQNGFWTGCLAGCGSLATVANNTCNGFGCCESNIPKGLRVLQIVLQSYYNHSRVFDFNPCSYAFIVDSDKFTFDTTWITRDYSRIAHPQLSTVLDWSIEGTNCTEANRTAGGDRSNASSTFACVSDNSECVASPNGLGYLCNCSAGYTGNPYLRGEGGCQDIDECNSDRQLYPCLGDCKNTPGSYSCSCPGGTYSEDPKKSKCVSYGLSLASKLGIGIGSGVLGCSLIASIFYLIFQKRKIQQLRKKLFAQNGGIFLQQIILSQQQSSFKIFTMDDMEKATKSFSKDFILGRGGFGVVYKGILDNGLAIAVKKSIMVDEKRNKEFAKELFILSQINHKNIVKLLGCCLESEVPMLVYEYISNGTLFDYIHKKKPNFHIPLADRLKFAIESAEALRYLHIDASPPILHGDVKSSNILLDENLVTKVSDFGTSILASKDKAQFTTFVQGTCGYLDPEYMQTSQLTDKSDVYSFGVILLELLTRRKPFYFEALEEEQNLAFIFISKMKENRLIDILDQDIIEYGDVKQANRVADLAIRCLHLNGDERPSMKEVVTTLERLYECRHHVHTMENNGGKNLDDQPCFNLETTEYVTKETHALLVFDGR